MNKVILCGRLTRDPEVRYSQGNNPTAIARGSIAVDRKYKQDGQPTADFINILAFGKTAGVFEKYVKKGQKSLLRVGFKLDHTRTEMEIKFTQRMCW